jgi:hypothetical protein
MIFDQTGDLNTLKRYDYLPFGEELFAPTGGRTAAQGYASGDGARQHFTQKERDIETGLDYFGAGTTLQYKGGSFHRMSLQVDPTNSLTSRESQPRIQRFMQT